MNPELLNVLLSVVHDLIDVVAGRKAHQSETEAQAHHDNLNAAAPQEQTAPEGGQPAAGDGEPEGTSPGVPEQAGL